MNMSKTKVLVYRNGGIIKKNEVLYYKDKDKDTFIGLQEFVVHMTI